MPVPDLYLQYTPFSVYYRITDGSEQTAKEGKGAMRKLYHILLGILIGCMVATDGHGQQKCVDAEGEAAIVNNDIPSARMESVARARWTAIEQVVGVDVKAGSFVQNFTLVDDVIKTQVGGVVRNHRVLKEENRGDTLVVRINACIEPGKAQQAVSSLALNNAVAVFIPAKKLNRELEETNIVSETLIGKLIEQGYTVTDIAPSSAVDAAVIDSAAKTGNYMTLRSTMYKFLSNVLIIGRIDPNISVRKGENIGYGLSMPFSNVTVRMNYRIVARNGKTGEMNILAAGTAEGKGLANSAEDAAASGLKNLVEDLTPVILDKMAQYIQGNMKKVRIRVNGVADLETSNEVKSILQNIVWVSGVEAPQMGEYIVGYPENTLYLANSIKQKGPFTVDNFSPYSIVFTYKP